MKKLLFAVSLAMCLLVGVACAEAACPCVMGAETYLPGHRDIHILGEDLHLRQIWCAAHEKSVWAIVECSRNALGGCSQHPEDALPAIEGCEDHAYCMIGVSRGDAYEPKDDNAHIWYKLGYAVCMS